MINDKLLQEKIGWKPHIAQEKILKADGREIVIDAGRRFGKSAISGYLALKTLLEPKKKVWIVSPSYDLSLKVFNYVVPWFLKVAPSQAKSVSFRPTPRIKMSNGNILECKSSENPVSLLGDEMDLCIIDEASRVPRRIYESYIFPALGPRKGKLVAISTPRGKNWFYELFIRAGTSAFKFPSVSNPTLDPKEIDRAKEFLPQDVFSQEYMAEFIDDAAAVFRGIKDIVRDGILKDVVPDHSYLMGVDVAKHTDFTVITVIDQFNNNVVYWDRFNQLDWPLQKARIKSVAQRYNNARITFDSTGIGDPIADDLRLDGLMVDDYKYTNQSKAKLIQKLSITIEQKQLSIPPIQVLIDELESFGYNMSESGNFQYGAPEGLHDDCVNSLALAAWNLQPVIYATTALKEELKRGGVKRQKLLI